MSKKRVVGFLFMLFGIALFFRNFVFTGAVIGSPPTNYLNIFGIVFFVIGLLIFSTATLEERSQHQRTDKKYYTQRANELTKVMGHGRDSWMSFYEANGILNELARRGYDIEHGDNMVAYTLSGKPMHVTIQEPYKGKRKHLFITKDPYDPRLKYVDVVQKEDRNVRTHSSYNPKHARKSGKETFDYLSNIKVEGKG